MTGNDTERQRISISSEQMNKWAYASVVVL